MDQQEFQAEYEKNIAWLQRNVPPDDIYDFGEQTLIAAVYFLKKYAQTFSYVPDIMHDPLTAHWIKWLMLLVKRRSDNTDGSVDLALEGMDDLL